MPGLAQINTAFWNLQNLFDVEPSEMATELGITAISGWDRRALEARITTLAGCLQTMFEGAGPDLIGLAEVENERVAQQLLEAAGRDDYALVIPDHPSVTTAGTALIYSRQVFDEAAVRAQSHLVHLRFPTCDILEVSLKALANGSDLTVLVNHWPSRRETNSTAFRQTMASHCARLVDRRVKMSRREYMELADTEVTRHQLADRWNSNLLLMGSLNDDPWADSIQNTLNAGYRLQAMRGPLPFPQQSLPSWRTYAACRPELFNPAWSLLARSDLTTVTDSSCQRRTGILDQIILSRGLVLGQTGLCAQTTAAGIPQIQCPLADSDTDPLGNPIPFSCDTLDGVSDRLPVGMSFNVLPAAVTEATDELTPEQVTGFPSPSQAPSAH